MSQTVQKDLVVAFNYTLRNDAGAVLDASEGNPMPYLHGYSNIVPGLENALEGKVVGDALQVAVPPALGYGDKNPQGLQQIPREAFGDMEIAAGMDMATEVEGQIVPFWIQEVGDELVKVDFNHPLSGQTLHYEVEIVAIREANDSEKEHGHPHGLDGTSGHHH